MKTIDLLAPGAFRAMPAAPAGTGFALMRDTGGTITLLAICINEEALKNHLQRHQAYDSLLSVLASSSANLVVVTASSLKSDVDAWLGQLMPQSKYAILAIDDSVFESSDVWPRDAMLCAVDENDLPCFLLPNVSVSGELAQWLTQQLGKRLTPLDICLDGGDSLVIDEMHWIVGAGAVSASLDRGLVPDWKSAPQKFADALGRRPPVIAGFPVQQMRFTEQFSSARTRAYRKLIKLRPQHLLTARLSSVWTATLDVIRNFYDPDALGTCWDHIDMVVSVTGIERDGKPVVLVGDCWGIGCPRGEDDDEKDFIERRKHKLDMLASILEEKGDLTVVRNPVPCVNQILLGCNNTVVQRPDTVWLPVFADDMPDLAAADAENVRIWEKDLKFTNVVQVKGWTAYRYAEGCIRCATLPLGRTPQ